MDDDDGEIRYHIKIIVKSNTIDLGPIVDALRLVPKIAWSVGDKIPRPSNSDSRRTFNYCVFNVTSGNWYDCEDEIDIYLDQLKLHKDYIDKLQLDGGSILLVVNWYVGHNRGFGFDFDFLEKLADLQIDLGIEIPHNYPSI